MTISARRTRIPARQLGGVENPATVLLHPVLLGDTATWWSYDQILIGGIKVNSINKVENGVHRTLIGYLPSPIPRSWEESEFCVVVEYEAETEEAAFKFRLHYGCGDPSELHLGETKLLEGKTGGKKRLAFSLHPRFLAKNELFRCSLEIARETPDPVLVYGAWLEVGVD